MANLLALFTLAANLIFGLTSPQQTSVFTFVGTVADSTTSQPLPFVNIIFYKKDGFIIDVAATDMQGHFEKKLSAHQFKSLERIGIQSIGYLDREFLFKMDGKTNFHYQIKLKPDTIELAPLTIITQHIMTTSGCITRSIVIDENGDTLNGKHKDLMKHFREEE